MSNVSYALQRRRKRVLSPDYNPLTDDVPSGTDLYAQIHSRPILGTPYYWHPERRTVYELHMPTAKKAAEPGSAEEGDEEVSAQEEYAYFHPVYPWGAPHLEECCLCEHQAGMRHSDEGFYRFRITGRPDIVSHTFRESELNDGSCWGRFPGLVGSSGRASVSRLADTVKSQVDLFGVAIRPAHLKTGWHKHPATGHWEYMLPDGRQVNSGTCPPSESVLVGYQLPAERAHSWAEGLATLPSQPPSPEQIGELTRFYQNASPHGHLLITTGAALRALLVHNELAPARTSLLCEGEQSSGKTSAAAHGRGVIGPSHYDSEVDAHCNSAAGGWEVSFRPLAGVPVIGDELQMGADATPKDARDLATRIDQTVRATFSGNEQRGRATRDGSAKREGATIETLPILIGEKFPPLLLSCLRRAMYLPFTHGDIGLEVMRAAEKDAQPILTQIGHALIRYVAGELDKDREQLARRIREQEESFTKQLQALVSKLQAERPEQLDMFISIPGCWARPLTGWWLAEQVLGLDSGEDAHSGPFTGPLWQHTGRWMLSQLEKMSGLETNEDGLGPFAELALRLAESIRDGEMIHGQRWCFLPYQRPDSFDYKAQDIVSDLDNRYFGWGHDDIARSPVTAGYVDPAANTLYLFPKGVEYLCTLTVHIPDYRGPKNQGELWKAAEKEGWIMRRGDGKHRAVKIGTDGKLGRAWALNLDKWLEREPRVIQPLPPAPLPSLDPPSQEEQPRSDTELAALDMLSGIDVMYQKVSRWRLAAERHIELGRPQVRLDPPGQPARYVNGRPLFQTLANLASSEVEPLVVYAWAKVAKLAGSPSDPGPTRPGSGDDSPTASVPPVPPEAPAEKRERPGSTPSSRILGVLDIAGVWVVDPASLDGVHRISPARQPENLGELFDLAAALHISQLWVHPSWTMQAGLPASIPLADTGMRPRDERGEAVYSAEHSFFAAVGAWDIDTKGKLFWWHYGYIPGHKDAYDIAFPQYNEQVGRWPWQHAESGPELLRGLRYFSLAFKGKAYARRSAGRTGTQLIKNVHQVPRGLSIEAPASLPDPVFKGGSEPQGLSWIRPLTDTERACTYLHSYDKNAEFLGACSGLALGAGEAQHLARSASPIPFDKHRPGFWHALLSDPVTSAPLPIPWVAPGEPRWYTTPTITLAYELDCVLSLDEAYTWAESHQVLAPWYQLVRDARVALADPSPDYPDEGARKLAYAAVKALYTQTFAWLGSSKWDRTGDALYRPDWRFTVVAQARVNTYRNFLHFLEDGACPFATAADCIYIVSNEPDPLACKPASMNIGQTLRDWKVKDDAVPLEEVLPLIEGGTLKELQAYLNQRRQKLYGPLAADIVSEE